MPLRLSVSRRTAREISRCAPALAVALVVAPSLGAQAPDAAWNDSATLQRVERAVDRRATEVVDTALQNYRADARGFVYFLLDAPELDRQSLVRTDQVAVEIHWRAPGEVRQRIVGLRERRELPVTRLYYYLDRLTVVQDNYADGIVIADGDNINDVVHPVSALGGSVYDYRTVDSLTLRLPGIPDPVRVHEVQVRPRDSSVPAVVGSIFLEERTGALVRMSFTFTPSAYVDPRLDYINVTLENGLWQGRYWLPYEQRLEIRREMPELDLPFGTIIRTRMRIGDYRFNEGVSDWLFLGGYPVSLAPRDQRETFAFEQPIDADWRLEGFGRPAEVAEIRGAAQTLLRERAISGLPRARIALGSVSDVLRYNRAEGAAFGFGAGLRPAEEVSARLQGGWAFGSRSPVARLDLAGGSTTRIGLSAYLNRAVDVGRFTPGSGVANTLGSFFLAADWTDPFHATGAVLTANRPLTGTWSIRSSFRAERQRSASLSSGFSILGEHDDFRPVRSIEPGDHLSGGLALRREQPAVAGGWWSEVRLGMGMLDGEVRTPRFGRVEAEGGLSLSRPEYRSRLDLSVSAGTAMGVLPRQEIYLVGGRGTLPGFEHRAFGGDRYALGRVLATSDLTHPWLRGRLSGGLGWTSAGGSGSDAVAEWGAAGSGGIRASVGIGVGIFYDLLQIDLARGMGGLGQTQVMIEVQPTFWGVL